MPKKEDKTPKEGAKEKQEEPVEVKVVATETAEIIVDAKDKEITEKQMLVRLDKKLDKVLDSLEG